MDEPLNNPVDSLLPQRCNYCTTGSADPGYKTCSQCRKKHRAYSAKAKELKRDAILSALAAAEADLAVSKPNLESGTLKRKSKDEDDSTSNVRKRKRVKHILKSYKSMDTEAVNVIPEEKNDAMKYGKDFQTASEMYKRLKKLALKNKPIDFKGSYSIVADPAVDNGKRASMVARDIRKLGHVALNHKVAISPATSSQTSYSLRFRCTCGHESLKKHSLKASLNRTETGKDIEGGGSCQGAVEVTVLQDLRHPMGLIGQQIRVHVCH